MSDDKGPIVPPPSEVVRLRRLLRKALEVVEDHGAHDEDCFTNAAHGFGDGTDCDCWVSVARKELGLEA